MSKEGYSGKPLIEKLGINPGMKVLLLHKPDNYFDLIEKKITYQMCTMKEVPDLIHLFVKNIKEFESEMKKINFIIRKNPKIIIWVSWFKKAANISSDITEDVIRDFALNINLVDVKVCAIDEKWSGLKLVVPLAKR